jgi:hypothetical protein
MATADNATKTPPRDAAQGRTCTMDDRPAARRTKLIMPPTGSVLSVNVKVHHCAAAAVFTSLNAVGAMWSAQPFSVQP